MGVGGGRRPEASGRPRPGGGRRRRRAAGLEAALSHALAAASQPVPATQTEACMPPPVGPCSPVDERLAPGAFLRLFRRGRVSSRHTPQPPRLSPSQAPRGVLSPVGRWALLNRSTSGWHGGTRRFSPPVPPWACLLAAYAAATTRAAISSAHLVAAAASCASDPSAHLGKARTATTMDTCAARIAGELTRLHLCALLCPRPCGAGWLMPRLPPSRGRRAGRGGLPSTRRRWGLALASAWRSDSTACSLVRCRPVLWLRRGARRSAEQVECDLQPGGGREVWRRRALPERRRRGICGAGGGDAARCVVVCRPARVWLGGREGG